MNDLKIGQTFIWWNKQSGGRDYVTTPELWEIVDIQIVHTTIQSITEPAKDPIIKKNYVCKRRISKIISDYYCDVPSAAYAKGFVHPLNKWQEEQFRKVLSETEFKHMLNGRRGIGDRSEWISLVLDDDTIHFGEIERGAVPFDD
jgi:hypothetical protein